MKRVFVAVLDWGLGHATRSIPVIDEFLQQGCEVILGSAGQALQLLRMEYPSLATVQLPAYDPRYPSGSSMAWAMFKQLPKFINAIRHEHAAITEIVRKYKIDVVISDNRYGCWNDQVPTVFITHQNNILMPQRFGWSGPLINSFNQRCIRKFTYCWIPDHPDNGLSGVLNANVKLDAAGLRTEYIGSLSRFKGPSQDVSKKLEILAVLSGPEPQRSLFEKILFDQLRHTNFKYLLVQGLPFSESGINDEGRVPFMNTKELQRSIEGAKVVIARSGYSTIMDLFRLRKNAILVPTPNQPEQEFLAKRMTELGYFVAVGQDRFDLHSAIAKLTTVKPIPENMFNGQHLLTSAVQKVLSDF